MVAAAVVFVVFTLVVLGLCVLWVLVVGEAPTAATTTRTTCVQPESVTYADGRYEVVVQQRNTLSLATPEATASVGREGSGASSGVLVVLNATGDADQVTCRWEPDRVEIVEASGIVHTVPAEVFMGGR